MINYYIKSKIEIENMNDDKQEKKLGTEERGEQCHYFASIFLFIWWELVYLTGQESRSARQSSRFGSRPWC